MSALTVLLGAVGGLTLPITALAATPDPTPVAPAEGAFLEASTVELEWTDAGSPLGYEVSWRSTDDTGDADESGVVEAAGPTTTIEVAGGSYSWQVRALPDGAWSAPSTFHVDLELPTLALPEEAGPVPAQPAALPSAIDRVPGGVWVVGALGFSAAFLAVVVVQSRRHREQDA